MTLARDPATGALSRPADPACEPEDPGDDPGDPGDDPEDPGDPGDPPPEPPPPEPCPPLPASALARATWLVPSPDGRQLLAIAPDYTSVLGVDAGTGELAEEDGYETAGGAAVPAGTHVRSRRRDRGAGGRAHPLRRGPRRQGRGRSWPTAPARRRRSPSRAPLPARPALRPPRAARCGREARLLAPAGDLALAPDGRFLYAALPRALVVLGVRYR